MVLLRAYSYHTETEWSRRSQGNFRLYRDILQGFHAAHFDSGGNYQEEQSMGTNPWIELQVPSAKFRISYELYLIQWSSTKIPVENTPYLGSGKKHYFSVLGPVGLDIGADAVDLKKFSK